MKYKVIVGIILAFLVTNIVIAITENQKRLTAERLFKEGVYYFNQREYIAASSKFTSALSSDVTYYKGKYWLGKAYYHSGYIQNAIIEWERALNAVGEDHLLQNKITRLLRAMVDPAKPKVDANEFLPTKGFSASSVIGLQAPISIVADRSELYWVVSYLSNRIDVFDKNGIKLHTIDQGNSKFKNPYDLAIASNGSFYVSDFGNDLVHKYDSNRKYLFSIGGSGINNGEFYGPQGLTLDKNNNLYVIDSENNRIQKFDPAGRFLLSFGKKGENYNELNQPCDILIIDNRIYVTDTGNHRIQVFDHSGNWIKAIGDNTFIKPKGIKSLSKNEIIVADEKKGILKVNLSSLNIKTIIPINKKLKSPSDIAIDKNNILYISDPSKYDILAYAPKQMKFNNLDVNILESNSLNFPKLIYKVNVKDQFGEPIYGLTENNFQLTEKGIYHKVKVTPGHKIKTGISIVFVNEKSNAMIAHRDHLKFVSKKVLESLSNKDRTEVIDFSGGSNSNNDPLNDSYKISQPFINNVLSPLKAILEKANSANNAFIGKALYKGISDAMDDNTYISAVVIITSGKLSENTFDPYGYEVCLNYAKNNGIPIYVISFAEKDNINYELELLAKSTKGSYFNAYTSNEIYKLKEIINKNKLGNYYITYKSNSLVDKEFKWQQVNIKVTLKDIFGHDRSGYFSP